MLLHFEMRTFSVIFFVFALFFSKEKKANVATKENSAILQKMKPSSFLRRRFNRSLLVLCRQQKPSFCLPAFCFSFFFKEKKQNKAGSHFFDAFAKKKTHCTKKKGGNKGIRTLGPCLAKAVLYQLSYIPNPIQKDGEKQAGPYWT
jgi:hypothetical protein